MLVELNQTCLEIYAHPHMPTHRICKVFDDTLNKKNNYILQTNKFIDTQLGTQMH